jgi:3-hydroxyacyl-CoA dehydrogenase/enoyl-CoA hydratase/3-hydroxybutyryl-CoA epimerase
VALHVAETMHRAYPDRFRKPTGLAKLVAAGRTSVYTTNPAGEQVIDPEAAELMQAGGERAGGDPRPTGQSEAPGGQGTPEPPGQLVKPPAAGGHRADTAPTGEAVREAALTALAEEIRIMLDEGVVAEAADVDLCMILGAGWPFHLGGITPYLDRTGVSEKVNGGRFGPRGVATIN